MKSYLCLLLMALIACQSVDKNNEIVLKASDFINEVFETIGDFFIKCNLDYYCINHEIYALISNFTAKEYFKLSEFIITNECQDFCVDKLSEKIEKYKSEVYCSNVCTKNKSNN